VEIFGGVDDSRVKLGDVSSVILQALGGNFCPETCSYINVPVLISQLLSTSSSVYEVRTPGPSSHVEVAGSVTHRRIQDGVTGHSVLPSKGDSPTMSMHSCMNKVLSLKEHADQKEQYSTKTASKDK
jgi:hypothetical protein